MKLTSCPASVCSNLISLSNGGFLWPSTVFVSGDGGTDLDLYVYDENGNLIDYDEDYSDDCLVRWNPRWTGLFTIVVKNQGRRGNRYAIITD